MMARIEVTPSQPGQSQEDHVHNCSTGGAGMLHLPDLQVLPCVVSGRERQGLWENWLIAKIIPLPSDAQSPHGGALSDHVTSGIGVLLGFDIHPCVPVVSDSSINLLICYENALIFG